MVWIKCGILLACGVLLCLSAERQQGRSGLTQLYVVQAGPGPGNHGAPGPHTYNVDLKVRSRRTGSQFSTQEQSQQKQLPKLSGVNVCGGQCCHGWSKAQGSQRCTKPNCVPQCQNGGMCLRPQLCVCKPGSKGQACEQKMVSTRPFSPLPGNEPSNGHNTRHTNGYNIVPQRPITHQVPPSGYASAPPPGGNMAQMKLTLKPFSQFVQPHYIQQKIRPVPIHPVQSHQYVIKPKYYQTHNMHTETQVQTKPERPIPLRLGDNRFHGGNHTGRIKVVFTPTICKLTCTGGRCHNNCQLGNTTTIISENGHATDTLTAPNFRVVVCHLPCINGGNCSTRNKCHCPPNFTGKFCQMSVPNRHQEHQQMADGYSRSQVHSTHTLPLTHSNGQSTVFSPSVVNIHIKHPPEASVQVHQVSQLENYHNKGHQLKGSQSGTSSSTSYTYRHTDRSQMIEHHGYSVLYPSQHGYEVPQYQPVVSKNTLGRCFQETAGSQCGKALPGLTKQEQCCGTIGTSWGFHKCQKCPKKSSIPLIDCPQGYKRINSSHCQDLDECQLQGVCPNGDCLNTVGSYRCMCKPGYVPDPSLTTCITALPATQEEKGACFRLVSSGRQCLHPVSAQLSKQLCCCSVGKAWGPHCDKCPPPGTATFKEICPGGMGYTVLPNPPFNKPVTINQQPMDRLLPQPLPTSERPVEAFGQPEEILPVATTAPDQELLVPAFSNKPVVEPVLPQLSPGVSTVKMEAAYPEVVERSSPLAPVEILPSNAGQDIAPTQTTEVDECQINPYICGPGICYNTADGYTCHCDEGYDLDVDQTTCVDIDECADKAVCLSGICFNVLGSFNCGSCLSGFSAARGQCVDIDECQDQWVCTRGHCLNTEGSFICQCGPGFSVSLTGDQCDDVDECVEERPCDAVGECVNNMGSYTCTCPQGYQQINTTSCRDVDECMDEPELCSPNGECLNTEGSYVCVCDAGFTANLDKPSCDDIDECGLNETLCGAHGFCENRLGSFRCLCDQGYQESQDGQACVVLPVERKECYYHLSDENLCESVLTSHVTLQECCCTLGAGWGDNCEVHPCPVNGTDQFNHMCPSGRGFIPRGDFLRELSTVGYIDADECTLFGQEVCKGGFCLDTVGSYECYCKAGQDYDPVKLECRDINECLDESVCDGGQCLNTDGSYMCFCTHPMILDPISNRCYLNPEAVEQQEEHEQGDYQGICWQTVTETLTCAKPLGVNRKTTYTECCCLYGEAWGIDCALCPPRNTEDYTSMCNLPVGGGRQPYGRDALTVGPVHEYEVNPDYSQLPDQQGAVSFHENEDYSYKAFEGLRAEECGVLNGCENGRCVRVHEGYTCDCFDGYTLDLSRMACIDVNECSELNSRMSLCKNGKCINTEGSYQCLCLPGYKASDKSNYCVEAAPHHTSAHTQ